MEYKKRVEIFVECIRSSNSANQAAAKAHKEHKLNAADSAGGMGSDQAAFREAMDILSWPFKSE